MSAPYDEAHSAVAVAIAERFLVQPRDMAWEERTDQLATAAIEAMQIFISMRPVVRRFKARIAAQVDRSRNGQDPQGLDAQHESAVVADDAPITGMGKSDQEGA